MSAFVCNKSHINALILAGLGVEYPPMSWYHQEQQYQLRHDNADEVGQMLLDENVRSVCCRYGESPMTDLPGRNSAEWLIPFRHHPQAKQPTPTQALKLLDCYEYQTCEHDDWEASVAYAFCDRLRQGLIDKLPGYADAPWSWDDPGYYELERATRVI